MVEESLRRYGAGRSMLVVAAGDAVTAQAGQAPTAEPIANAT